MHLRTLALAVVAALALPALALSAPTPVPGGANQMKAISGKVGQTLFNGKIRLKVETVRDETAAESADGGMLAPGQKMVLIEAIARNGMNLEITIRPAYTLADKDDVTQSNNGPPTGMQTITMAPGAAGRLKYRMPVPKDFVPTKLLVDPGPANQLGLPFRITLGDDAPSK